jgi:hypothetical protein
MQGNERGSPIESARVGTDVANGPEVGSKLVRFRGPLNRRIKLKMRVMLQDVVHGRSSMDELHAKSFGETLCAHPPRDQRISGPDLCPSNDLETDAPIDPETVFFDFC